MISTQLSLLFDAPPPFIPAYQPELTTQPDLSPELPLAAEPVVIASGEKSKARDIIAAIRTVKAVEHEQRSATREEKQALARFAGFGPVALSIFPNPVTGNYKDASWQSLGEELKTLLTPEEYDSTKRTTRSGFPPKTSPAKDTIRENPEKLKR